jgi:serine/threonine protein kinase
MSTSRNTLPEGFKIHWYVIKSVLGQGGFGITYLAEDTNLNQLVAIKEYLPVEMAYREGNHSIQPLSGEHGDNFQWGLERFINEAQTLAKFKHENIVRVYSVFTENNTAYMVMDYEHGLSFDKQLKQEKTLNEENLKRVLFPLLDGLENIHDAGFIHRDIKPPNIYIRENGTPVLLDFGSARQSLGVHTRTLTTLVSPGYAPFEQYVSKSDKQGPWTDIYGLSATLYRAVTGLSPPNAVDRSEALLNTGKDIYVPASEISINNYSIEFLNAIDHGMAFKYEDRPEDIKQWRLELEGQNGDAAEVPASIDDHHDTKVESSSAENETVKITMLVPDAATETATEYVDTSKKTVKKKVFTKKRIAVAVIILIILASRDKPPVEIEQARDDTNMEDLDSVAIEPSDNDAPIEPRDNDLAIESRNDDVAVVDTNIEIIKKDTFPVSDNSKTTDEILPAQVRLRLAALREDLKNNTDKKETEKGIRNITNELNKRVREAMKEGNRPLAEAYLKEALKLAPNNKRLKEALEKYSKNN